VKNAFLLSLSHGPLAIALPIVWLLSLPIVFIAFKRLRRVSTLGSLLVRILLLAVEVGLTVLVLIGCLHVGCAREVKWQARCTQNLREISTAIAAYIQDWNECLPLASNWMEAVKIHLPPQKTNQVFTCPSAYSPFGYAFNFALSGLPLAQVTDLAATVTLFECDSTKPNAHGGMTNLPKIPRHLEGDIYAFVDGHVKWYRRIYVTSLHWKP